MLTYPQIDPVALSLGPLQIHWYGLMYLMGFGIGYLILLSRRSRLGLSKDQVGDFLFYCALGVILGGRMGYVFFYGFDRFANDPLWLFRIWEGGMSFHGGFLGVVLAVIVFAKQTGTPLLALGDYIAVAVPPGIFFGRIGNFIGGELWGRPVSNPDFALGMVFPHVDALARHPSQLYEATLEGLLLFVVLYVFSMKPRPHMATAALFILGYGLARFSVEFFREPDIDQGFILFDWMTKGQILTLPMIAAGAIMLALAYRRGYQQRLSH